MQDTTKQRVNIDALLNQICVWTFETILNFGKAVRCTIGPTYCNIHDSYAISVTDYLIEKSISSFMVSLIYDGLVR